VAELLENWARMEPFVVIGLSNQESSPHFRGGPAELQVVKTWAELFKEEIGAVRRARDFAAHIPSPLIPATDLVQANEMATRLLDLLGRRLPELRNYVVDASPWWSAQAPSRAQGRQPGKVAPPPPPPAPSPA
jgi:hypothetical protein